MTDKQHSGSAGQQRGHETSDAAPGWLLWFGAGLAMLTLFVFLSMGWMFHYLEDRIAESEVPFSPLSDTGRQPPEPRLQVNPAQDLRRLAETESRRLNSYGWVDRQAGLVRIPIGRAIQIVAEKGLPARENEAD